MAQQHVVQQNDVGENPWLPPLPGEIPTKEIIYDALQVRTNIVLKYVLMIVGK